MEAKTDKLPSFLRDMLASPPRHGQGVHNWLFRTARYLHALRSEKQIFILLRACLEDCGRHVPDKEIWDAIHNAKRVAWHPTLRGITWVESEPSRPRWPSLNEELRARAAQDGLSLCDLWENSPVRFEDNESHAEDVVPALLPGNPLVCVGKEKTKATTAPLNRFKDRLKILQFIVPNPMLKPVGKNQAGKNSARCLDNVGPRKYLIVEFDLGSLDHQAALLSHLAVKAPLACVVFSGSKSLHGWFAAQDRSEEQLSSFMRYCARLGADPANFTRCQFVRMPGGLRDTGQRQTIYYFNPEVVR